MHKLWMDGVGSKAQLLYSLQAPEMVGMGCPSISMGDDSTKCGEHCAKQWMQRSQRLEIVTKVGTDPLNPAGQEVSAQRGCGFPLWGQQCSVTACIPWAAVGRVGREPQRPPAPSKSRAWGTRERAAHRVKGRSKQINVSESQ